MNVVGQPCQDLCWGFKPALHRLQRCFAWTAVHLRRLHMVQCVLRRLRALLFPFLGSLVSGSYRQTTVIDC